MEPRANDSGLVPSPISADGAPGGGTPGDGAPGGGGGDGRGPGNLAGAAAAVERALRAVDEREAVVHAWAYLDRARARAEARAVDTSLRSGSGPRPLAGMVLGVKDVFDTADQPTEYGSPIFAGFQPRADAGAVQLLRSAGAVCLGKTVTSELAFFHPGPTTNPHRQTHTPGGSSMGSAAAVATGMADIAIGTQTAGSITRPASYCGVLGFKPTFGLVTSAGVKEVAPSINTVGWFARSVAGLDAVRVALTGRPPMTALARPPRLALLATGPADAGIEDVTRCVDGLARLACPSWLTRLTEGHAVVHRYEAAKALAWEHRERRDLLSPNLVTLLDQGAATNPVEYDAALADAQEVHRSVLPELFGSYEALLVPSATGEAPQGLSSTGDPNPCRAWTLLGLPCLSVPGLLGPTGLPVGVQVVGPRGGDALVLAIGAWLAPQLQPPSR